jgi:hypothetical protein
MEQPSHASEVPQLKSFEDDQIPVSSLPPCKDPYLMDQEYFLCAFAKHQQQTLVIPPSWTIPALEVGPPLEFVCLGHNVLAERDADLESNLVILARKQSLAYHDDAPQYFPVCGIFSIVYRTVHRDG